MRVSREKAEENRRTVVDTASKLFREHGFDGIGVAGLMKGAGLTQGGFYKQFESKEDLAVQAMGKALEGSEAKWGKVIGRAKGDPMAALADFYLSELHRDSMAEGCGLAALGSEVARHGPDMRAAFEAGLRRHVARIDDIIAPGGDSPSDAALARAATMIGALILSRAVAGEALSNQILTAARDAVAGHDQKGNDA